MNLLAVILLLAAPLQWGSTNERMYVQNNWQFITLDPATGAVLDTKPLQPLIANRGLIYDEGRLFFLDQNVLIVRDQLFELHPATGRAIVAGVTGHSYDYAAVGFAKDPSTGKFYVTFAYGIFELDKDTGAITYLARMNPEEPISRIAIDSGGKAYGVTDPSSLFLRNRLFQMDVQTGELTLVGPLDVGLGFFRAIAFDASDQLWGLYTKASNPFQHTLYKIDIASLSVTEAFPLPQGASGIAFGPAPSVTSYCAPKTNSAGCLPRIDWKGHPSVDAHMGFQVTCSSLRDQSTGMLLVGTGGRASLPFQGGVLCVAQPWTSTPPVFGGAFEPASPSCGGVWSVDLNTWLYGQSPVAAGTVLNGQWWGRDPGMQPPDSAQLSDALEITLMP